MAVFMSSLDGMIILIALPAIFNGIHLDPLTAGFFIAGPVSGALSDRFGARRFASGGMFLFAMSFVGLLLLPVNFPYVAFALLIALNGAGTGMYSSPNSSSIMSSVPAEYRRCLGDAVHVPELRSLLTGREFFPRLISGPVPRRPGPGLRRLGRARPHRRRRLPHARRRHAASRAGRTSSHTRQ
jgi:hypothetical protein